MNNLSLIPKIEKYIEYMLIILLKLPRTEKYSIGTEIKTSMYNMLKNILLANKSDKIKRLPIYNIVDIEILQLQRGMFSVYICYIIIRKNSLPNLEITA